MKTSILGLGLLALVAACRPSESPAPIQDAGAAIEAGIYVGTGICRLIEGVTENQAVIFICATLEEIAEIAAFVGTFFGRRDMSDAGTQCVPIPTTKVCATREQLGEAITHIIGKRQLRLLRDSGAR